MQYRNFVAYILPIVLSAVVYANGSQQVHLSLELISLNTIGNFRTLRSIRDLIILYWGISVVMHFICLRLLYGYCVTH